MEGIQREAYNVRLTIRGYQCEANVSLAGLKRCASSSDGQSFIEQAFRHPNNCTRPGLSQRMRLRYVNCQGAGDRERDVPELSLPHE
jgi:hypothetical protein